MQRVVPVPDDVPNGYETVVMVFMEFNASSNSGFCCHASDALVESLKSLPLDKRAKVIKTICSNIQLMLLQYSQNDGEVTSRRVAGPNEC